MKDDLRNVGTDAAEMGKKAVEAGKSTAREAKERIQDTVREAAVRGKWGVRRLRGQVHERPLVSVGTAFGIGLAAGLIFGGSGD